MKLRLILILSVCVNLALAGAYFIGKRSPIAPEPTTSAADAAKSITKSSRERRAQIVVNGVTNDFRWGSVESDDYRQYIANLREIGCPEETIRDIIIADVNKLYAGRLAALYPSPQDFKWWQTDDRANRDERRDRERKRRDLNEEKRALIKELLDVDLETEMARWEGRPDDDAWRTGFLSAEKQQAVQALQEKFREMERSLFNELRENRGSPESRAKMLALRSQREAELAQILGPQDYQEYQLRNSNTAREMRDSLGSFSPSQEEFKKIFELRENFSSQYGFGRGGGDDAAREQRRAAEQQLDQQLQTALGDRYAEYKLSQDDRYREIYDFTTRMNLPKETAQSVYDIRQAVEQQRQQVMNNQGMSAEERTATLAQMAQVTKETLAQTLPQQAYDQYLRSDDARWLQALTSTRQGPGGGGRGGFGGFPGGGPGGPGGGGADRRFFRGGGGGR